MNVRTQLTEKLRCRCGCGLGVEPELTDFVLLLGQYMGYRLTPVSGARCPTYNRRVGGVVNSQHLRGLAVDISHSAMTRSETDRLLLSAMRINPHIGVGVYTNFAHLDLRGRFAFWNGRSPAT